MSRKKQSYHHGDLRQSLLDTALDIVVEGGLSALTTKELSVRLGVSAPALYRHYRNRRDLILGVFELAIKRMFDSLVEAKAHATSVYEAPILMAQAIIAYGEKWPQLYKLLNEIELVEDGDDQTEAYRLHLCVNREIDNALHDANPELNNGALRERSLLMWFIIYGYVMVRIMQPHKAEPEDPEAKRALREKLIRIATGVH